MPFEKCQTDQSRRSIRLMQRIVAGKVGSGLLSSSLDFVKSIDESRGSLLERE